MEISNDNILISDVAKFLDSVNEQAEDDFSEFRTFYKEVFSECESISNFYGYSVQAMLNNLAYRFLKSSSDSFSNLLLKFGDKLPVIFENYIITMKYEIKFVSTFIRFCDNSDLVLYVLNRILGNIILKDYNQCIDEINKMSTEDKSPVNVDYIRIYNTMNRKLILACGGEDFVNRLVAFSEKCQVNGLSGLIYKYNGQFEDLVNDFQSFCIESIKVDFANSEDDFDDIEISNPIDEVIDCFSDIVVIRQLIYSGTIDLKSALLEITADYNRILEIQSEILSKE